MGAIARVALTNQPARDGGWDDTAPTLEFGYTNWRGEQSTRRVWPIRLWYGATEYHPDKQWFLKAFDTDKQAERDFALRDIRNLQPDQAALDVAQGRQTEAERRADALERERAADHTAFRSIKYHADNGHQDRPVHVRLRMISQKANERIDAALAQQEPDQPAQDGGRLDPYTLAYVEKMVRGQQYRDWPFRHWPEFWPGTCSDDSLVTQFADRTADAIRNLQPDQPAQDGEPSTDQERFERVWQQLVYSVADFFALEITDAQAQSIAREVLQVADAGEQSCRKCGYAEETFLRDALCRSCNGDGPKLHEPSCCAGPREEERERCARQLEATAARLEQRAATAPTVALRTGLNADARMCRMNAAAIRRTDGDTV
jgi:hypothetical protein